MSLRKRLLRQEGALISWIVLCAYLLIAFSSYSKDDASFSYTGSAGGITTNAAGPAGAWLADIFFSLSGYVAYLFPLLLAARAWNVFQQRKIADTGFDGVTFILRLVGLALAWRW